MGEVTDFVKSFGLVVLDEHGVHHASVLCNSSRVPPNATVDAAPRVDGAEPFVVAMCDLFECIDQAVMYEPTSLKHPDRRWPVDQEAPGVITCLFCLGQ